MSQIKQVKDANEIIEIIGERLDLKRAGSSFKANCPFHGEKTPSFFVNEVLQRYKCFGCGESGDVINFLEKYESMTFAEALEYLAGRVGIKLETYQKSDGDEEREQLLEALDLAKQYYAYLLSKHKAGKVARKYLGDRGVTSESIKLFNLGFSLDSWDGLIKFLHKKKKIRLELLEKAGLVIARSGRYYDRFRGRIMFPLRNHRGQVVGFSGRTLDAQAKEAKYINSPETSLYHKSEMLFGFSELHQEIRKKKELVVAEGELDVISSAQAHVNNIVAIKGSALTKEHVKLMVRTVSKVILALDRDNAGIEATKRAIEVASGSGLELRVVNLDVIPKQQREKLKDPDDIACVAPKLWREAVKTSTSVYEFLLQVAIKGNDITTPEGKRDVVVELAGVFEAITHNVEKDFYLKKLAKILEVKKELIEDDFRKINLAKNKLPSARVSAKDDELIQTSQKLSSREKLERYLLFLLLNFPPGKIADHALEIKNLEFKIGEIRVCVEVLARQKMIKNLKQALTFLPEDIKEFVGNIYLNPKYLTHIKDLKIQSEWEIILARLQKKIIKDEVGRITLELDELEKKTLLSEEDEQRQGILLQQIVELKRQ